MVPVEDRPERPSWNTEVWYRGWEAGEDEMASFYTDEGFRAYKGGADLDAPTLSAATWEELLDLIDDEEEEE